MHMNLKSPLLKENHAIRPYIVDKFTCFYLAILGDSNLGRARLHQLKGTKIEDVRRTGSRTARQATTPQESEPGGALDLCMVCLSSRSASYINTINREIFVVNAGNSCCSPSGGKPRQNRKRRSWE